VRRLLVATANPGKQREFRRMLAPLDAEIVTPDQLGIDLDVPEPYDTYAENAITKAQAYRDASGLAALADDSGIEVAALDWAPGPRSARFGGLEVQDRAAHLLSLVGDAVDRRARMVCVLAVASPGDDAEVRTFEGVMEGSLALFPRGSGGFGHDPLFLPPAGVTTGELPEAQKDAVSHRGRAVEAALPYLRELLAGS
jgi:XTP/dITP diphosphohydrolase